MVGIFGLGKKDAVETENDARCNEDSYENDEGHEKLVSLY